MLGRSCLLPLQSRTAQYEETEDPMASHANFRSIQECTGTLAMPGECH